MVERKERNLRQEDLARALRLEMYYKRRDETRPPEYLAAKAARMLQFLRRRGTDFSAFEIKADRESILRDALLDALA